MVDITELENAIVNDDEKGLLEVAEKVIKLLSIHLQNKFGDEIVERHPYWNRKISKLNNDYFQLIYDFECIRREEDRRGKISHWLKRFRNCKMLENCLLLDSFNQEYGSDHT